MDKTDYPLRHRFFLPFIKLAESIAEIFIYIPFGYYLNWTYRYVIWMAKQDSLKADRKKNDSKS